jgi:ribosomal protein L40E
MRVQSQTEITFDDDEAEEKRPAELICGVCGQAIESDLVRCRKCRSPHHRDCWDYNGRCSTYGCQEGSWIA